MSRNRRAKIVATLGPASSSPEMIRKLYDAGVDMFRLNFSHGTHEDHRARYEAIRAVEREVGTPIAILQDLQGPKIRLGPLEGGKRELTNGSASSAIRLRRATTCRCRTRKCSTPSCRATSF